MFSASVASGLYCALFILVLTLYIGFIVVRILIYQFSVRDIFNVISSLHFAVLQLKLLFTKKEIEDISPILAELIQTTESCCASRSRIELDVKEFYELETKTIALIFRMREMSFNSKDSTYQIYFDSTRRTAQSLQLALQRVVTNSEFYRFITKNIAYTLGIPVAVLISFIMAVILPTAIDPNAKIEVGPLKVEGSGGMFIIWIACYMTLIASIRLIQSSTKDSTNTE